MDIDTPVRCRHCGCRGNEHKGGTDGNGERGTCPPTNAYGIAKPFPKFKSDKAYRAGGSYDKALARYWSSKTTFKAYGV